MNAAAIETPTKVVIIRENARNRMVTFTAAGDYSMWGALPDDMADALAEVASRIKAYGWGAPSVEIRDRDA